MSDFITEQFGKPALKCPDCGTGWLHQTRVEVFARDSEDAREGMHVTVDYRDGISIDRSMDENVSRRRDGIRISFECEQCGMQPRTLRITQHKGNEFVSWEDSDE